MSSYIIAGSADSIDTSYCEQIARRIKAKYKNIDFRIVIKHPTQWDEYLQQICRIYGFLKKSNPIIYTFDGKIIGNKEAFMSATAKYFGLDQDSLIVQNLTNQVNMKIATQEINRKKRIKNNIQSFSQRIQSRYEDLLKKNILKHQLKQKNVYLTNGVEYIHRNVKGLVPNMVFTKNKQVKVSVEQVFVSDIDIMAVSLNDQIKVDEQPVATNVATTGKEAFVTTNQKNNSEHDKMSQASRTNKMHESVISYDKDSKQMKQSSKSKLRIDEQNDQIPDYVDFPMTETAVTQLADGFYVGFYKNSHITGQMVFYHNQDSNGNSLRLHNDNRPVKGHRVLVKQIHFDGQNAILQQNSSQMIQNQDQILSSINHGSQERLKTNQQNNQGQLKEKKQQTRRQSSNSLLKPKQQIEKIRTQPNIPSGVHGSSNKNIPQQDDVLSQINSDLNLLSHLNYHTLFIMKPLSSIQLKNVIHFIKQTDCIGCLQFLGQNPNPRVKLYDRKLLLQLKKQNQINLKLPIQKFIEKQIQDGQYQKITVPNENNYDYEYIQSQQKFELLQINDIGFQHYIYSLQESSNPETIAKILKCSIDSMLSLQQQLKKDIGYNLIFTKKFILLVPLAEPYQIYNQNKLYLDGLAYLGFIHTADLIKPYSIKNQKVSKMGNFLRNLLSKCSNGKQCK